MLNPIAFANSLAIVSGAVYLALYVLAVVWRDAFRFVFNAQFLGADVASLLPHKRPATGFVATLVALVVSAWLLGFCWAWLYNRLVG
jgi:2TM family of unknown function (DUF5676)